MLTRAREFSVRCFARVVVGLLGNIVEPTVSADYVLNTVGPVVDRWYLALVFNESNMCVVDLELAQEILWRIPHLTSEWHIQ